MPEQKKLEDMTVEECLSLIDQTLSKVSGSRHDHLILQFSMNKIVQELNALRKRLEGWKNPEETEDKEE
jgi:hypothetical protein